MKLIQRQLLVGLILTLPLTSVGVPKGRCDCAKPSASEEPAWTFETITIVGVSSAKGIYGRAVDPAYRPMPGALVEIYEASSVSRKDSSERIEPRLAVCKTDKSGNFCFSNIKSGRYIVSVTAGLNFCRTEVIVNVNSRRQAHNKPLEVRLELGK